MKRAAILTCLKAVDVCAGCSCLTAFYDRKAAFARYQGQDLRLTAFLHCSHCHEDCPPEQDPGLLEKLDRLGQEGTEAVHIGVCAKGRDGALCPGMGTIVRMLEKRGIPVVYGTHGTF